MYSSRAVTSEELMAQATVNVVHHNLGSTGERQNKYLASYRERCGIFPRNLS